MHSYREIIKESTIAHRVHIRCEIPVPDVYGDETAARAMGSCPSEKEENIAKFVEEMLAPQYFRAVQGFIEKYERSPFPNDLIYKQEVRIEALYGGLRGVYDNKADVIIEDADTCIMRDKGLHVFGYSFGHKLFKFKHQTAVNRALWDVAGIVGISDTEDLRKILCDAAGNVLTGEHESTHVLQSELSKVKIEGIERIVLRLAWAV